MSDRQQLAAAVDPRNLVEPLRLISLFLADPPRGFLPCLIGETDPLPGFVTEFDVTTTLDPWLRVAIERAPMPRRLRAALRRRVLFAGTTVSEYLPYPSGSDPRTVIADALRQAERLDAEMVILKDIPRDSPLLSREDNEAAAELRRVCREREFVIVAGQALAYVPIDFDCESTYLGKLSRARRKDLRRKLKSRDRLQIEELPTGSLAFADEALLEELVGLYRNVYEQSLIHFDELTPSFLRALFRGNDGVAFLYRLGRALIGFNLCFVHRDHLVDKYVGFAYPEARATNLYFVSWFHNLEWARQRRLRAYVAGWTDPEVKRALGARFTFTDHAVYVRNVALRSVLRVARRWFESDASWAERRTA
jgi:predicted N-acyltransferase